MGFKGFILLVLLLIFSILTLQNLQPMSLVFFGSKPITLPLSIWILLFTGAGIFSSLVIYLLSGGSSTPKKVPNQSQFPDKNYPPYPPSQPSSNTPKNRQPKPSEKRQSVPYSYQPEPEPELEQDQRIYQDEIDELDNEVVETIQVEKIEPKDAPILDDREPEIQDTINREKEENQVQEDDDFNEDAFTKPRPASLYSYSSRERTEIKPKSTPKTRRNYPQQDVYDADYRVILPPSRGKNQPNQDDDSYYDGDEDWDF